MKNKRVLMLLALTTVLSVSMTACNFGGGSDEDSSVVQVTPTPEPTKAAKATPTPAPANAQNTTYTSKNKAVSIKLPDATWANKSDSDDMLSFESPKQGKLLILHGSGEEDMSVAIIPSSQDTASALVKADNLVEGTDFVGTDDPDYDTDQTRTIYRNSDGYPLVIYPNGDGTWCDDDGNTYDFANGEDVYDENGVDYYYHGEPAYVRYMPKNQ